MQKSKMDNEKIKQIYSRIIGIESYLEKEHPHNVRKEVADNYSKLLIYLEGLTKNDLDDFKIPPNAYYVETNEYCYMDLFLPKLTEFRHFLEASYPFVKQGNLPSEVRVYLSIRDGLLNFIKRQVEKRI